MLLPLKNTVKLTSSDFIETFSIEMWSDKNIYLLNESRKNTIPDYFYVTAYLLQFETEFEMSGLTTLLSNSSTYNFENTLISFREIGSTKSAKCLEGILNTLQKYDLTPIKMREWFLNHAEGLSEYSIIKMGQAFKGDDLLDELGVYDNELSDICSEIRTDLEEYLIKIRGQ